MVDGMPNKYRAIKIDDAPKELSREVAIAAHKEVYSEMISVIKNDESDRDYYDYMYTDTMERLGYNGWERIYVPFHFLCEYAKSQCKHDYCNSCVYPYCKMEDVLESAFMGIQTSDTSSNERSILKGIVIDLLEKISNMEVVEQCF